MKKLIILLFLILSFQLKGQNNPDYIIGLELPGISINNINFSILSDTVQNLENRGWKILIQGKYALNNYKENIIEDNEINRFSEIDSSISILFYTNGGDFNFTAKVNIYQNPEEASRISLDISNYLTRNVKSYNGQILIDQIILSLNYLNNSSSNNFDEECGLGRNTDSLITAAMITKEDMFFMSPSGIPIFVKSGSKVEFFVCNGVVRQNGNVPEESFNAKGMMLSFTSDNKKYEAFPIVVNNQWIFNTYKHKLQSGEFEEYNPVKTFSQSSDKVYLGIYSDICKNFTLKIYKYENYENSSYPNKMAGPIKSIDIIKEKFTFEYKPIVDMGASYNPSVGWQFVEPDNSIEIPCPPLLDWSDLNKAISGANYTEYFNNGQTIVIYSKDGTRLAYHKYDEDDVYWIYSPIRDKWFIAELTTGTFIKEIKQLLDAALLGSLKAAIMGVPIAVSAEFIIPAELLAAGSLYAIEGDEESLAMDLILAPLGPVGDGIQMYKNANKVKEGLKNINKFDELTSSTFKSYIDGKKIKGKKTFLFINKNGKAVRISEEMVNDLKNQLGNDYSSFIDDLVDIASTNKNYIKLLEKVDGGYPYVIAWKTLIMHPLIRKDLASLTSVSKILGNSNITNIISKTDLEIVVDKLARKGVRCRTCGSGNPFYKYLDEVLDDLEHGAIKFGVSYTKVITDIKKGENFAEGAMWVAECVKKYGNDFPPGTTVFEEVFEGGIRRVDVRIGNTFFEFKSVVAVPPSRFAEQFINDMRLGEVISLNQLKWWFDGKKVSTLPKQQFLDQLETGLQNLTPNLRDDIIEKLAPANNQTLGGLLNKIDSDFNAIFSIK